MSAGREPWGGQGTPVPAWVVEEFDERLRRGESFWDLIGAMKELDIRERLTEEENAARDARWAAMRSASHWERAEFHYPGPGAS